MASLTLLCVRYNQKISKFSKCSECKKENMFLTLLSAPQLSASSNERKFLEVLSILSTTGQLYNLHFNNNCICKKMKYERILRIMSHPLSKYFQAAAAKEAQKYKLITQDYHKISDNTVDIIRQKRNYLNLKDKIEKVVKIVSFETLPVIAHMFDIDESKLREEFQKYLENKNEYEYDEFTSSNKILTYKEESSLLTLIQKWKNYPSSCHCLVCAMEFLCMQAYIIYTSREESQGEWNTQVEINWLFEFEVRHNKEFSKYMPPDMIQFKAVDSQDLTKETLELLEKYVHT